MVTTYVAKGFFFKVPINIRIGCGKWKSLMLNGNKTDDFEIFMLKGFLKLNT